MLAGRPAPRRRAEYPAPHKSAKHPMLLKLAKRPIPRNLAAYRCTAKSPPLPFESHYTHGSLSRPASCPESDPSGAKSKASWTARDDAPRWERETGPPSMLLMRCPACSCGVQAVHAARRLLMRCPGRSCSAQAAHAAPRLLMRHPGRPCSVQAAHAVSSLQSQSTKPCSRHQRQVKTRSSAESRF